jgi:hypothetical protein
LTPVSRLKGRSTQPTRTSCGGISVEALDAGEEVGCTPGVAGFPRGLVVYTVESLGEVDVGHVKRGLGAVRLLLETA